VRPRTGSQILATLLGLSLSTLGLSEIFHLPSAVREADAAAPVGTWWNQSYAIRQKITITAGTTAVPTQYSVPVTFNHASLVTGAKSLASGNDVRIVYWNGSGWTELDRLAEDSSPWNTTTTKVWFRTQAAISASASDDNYYMYYRNPSAGSPPTNWANVFLFYDDFNGTTLDTARWTCGGVSASCTESGGNLVVGSQSHAWANSGYAQPYNTAWEGRVRLSVNAASDFNYWGGNDQAGYSGNYTEFWSSATTHYYEQHTTGTVNGNFANSDATSFHIYALFRETTAGVRYLKDGTQVGYLNTYVPTVNLRVWLDNLASGQTQTYDWARVRKYVTPEPTSALATAEAFFEYKRPVTVKAFMTSSIPGCSSSLSNFPILVSFSDNTLRTKANGGNVYSSSGYDIIFRDASGTQLDHEIEKYDGTTTPATLVAWVKIPTLPYNADTTIYMFYGNATITAATANPTGVWSNGYVGVWHLKETAGGSGAIKNSTANVGLNGTDSGSPTFNATGKANGAINFDGLDDHIAVTDPGTGSVLDFGTGASITLSAWIRPDTLPVTSSVVMKGDSTSLGTLNYGIQAFNSQLAFSYWNGSTYSNYVTNANVLATGNWYNTAFTYTFGTASTAALYVNGGSQAATWSGNGSAAPTQSNDQLWFGDDVVTERFDGILDEIRISNTARSPCWIGVEYNTVNYVANTSYIQVGSEQAASPTAVGLVSLDAVSVRRQGVLVSWRTGFEVDNLGFHVYREVDGERVRVTPSLVAGSALIAGAGTPLTAGRWYSWWDTTAVPGASYWLEEWELSGAKRWHGPVSVQAGPVGMQARALGGTAVPSAQVSSAESGQAKPASSPLLSGLGQTVSASSASAVGTGSVQRVRRKLAQGEGTGEDRLAVQWGLAAGPAVKILVSGDGWYRVSQEELVTAGLDPGVDPGRLQLYADGREVPILVDVRQQGRFAGGDGVEFYGQGLDTPWTGVRVYWLVVGSGPGARVQEVPGGGQWAEAPASFACEVERADHTVYVPAVLNGATSNFFGAVVTSAPVSESVRVVHLDPGGSGEIAVRLQGGTAGSHQVGVELNGVRVGTVVWQGMEVGELAVPLGPGMLVEGANQVSLAAEGGDGDVSVVASIRVRYEHTWEADSEVLEFSLGGYQEVSIGGFRSSKVRVVDVTDPWAVEALPAEVVEDGTTYRVRVGVPEAGDRTLLAVGSAGAAHPVGVVPNRPTAWHAATNGADLVIIGHRSLLAALEPLRALRERQGLKVAVVDVENVYDEFAYGAKDPQAIRDFMAYAKAAWSRSPRYLLLVGDASFDPRNYLGYGWADLVPSQLVDTSYMETDSDDWMTDFNSDGIADVPVGRLPVQTTSDATTVVTKLVAYDSGPRFGRVLLLSDANDEGNDFEAMSAQVRAALPSSVWVSEIRRGQDGDAAAASELASQLNLGQTLVNYLGHGSVDTWRGGLLTAAQAAGLRNYYFPVVVSMTCLNGFFSDPQQQSLAGALLGGPGGAIAVWASSGLSEARVQVPMDEALLRLLFSGTTTLGEATQTAKAATPSMDVRRSWILFGDPSTKLK
jgi:hypothetical protein